MGLETPLGRQALFHHLQPFEAVNSGTALYQKIWGPALGAVKPPELEYFGFISRISLGWHLLTLA